jgi:WD40 repeat protein
MTADGGTLALGSLYGGIYLWDISKRTISKTIRERKKSGPGSPPAIFGITISPDGRTVVSGSTEGGLQFWNADGGDPVNMRDPDGSTVR